MYTMSMRDSRFYFKNIALDIFVMFKEYFIDDFLICVNTETNHDLKIGAV